jgi:phosphomannomutase
MLDEYVFELKKSVSAAALLHNLNIAWDAGNGIAGVAVEKLLKGEQAHHTCLYLESDSRFPNHHPDPSVAKNIDLQTTILPRGAASPLA